MGYRSPEQTSQNATFDPRGGVGGTLIFSYIRRLGHFFLVQNFEFQYVFGFSEKMIFFVTDWNL